jgi:hypothetical protein
MATKQQLLQNILILMILLKDLHRQNRGW